MPDASDTESPVGVGVALEAGASVGEDTDVGDAGLGACRCGGAGVAGAAAGSGVSIGGVGVHVGIKRVGMGILVGAAGCRGAMNVAA